MNARHKTHCIQIVEHLLKNRNADAFVFNTLLNTSNSLNRVSDCRKYGAPIESKWIDWQLTSGQKTRFKLYRLSSKKAGREWLKGFRA